ncbi:hypothetical protein NLJ89_g10475 [Agrocybe chaxingu]|uniref:FAD dependent oxidoreductase domain-containing protein n=1 Tax=Agrocybe chaxingu TaxID=84603 RepID=A0A9W8JR79_9AGAR|nr:hypothetical protein NLJ89_g10475 [Agrocybe chaxingu]
MKVSYFVSLISVFAYMASTASAVPISGYESNDLVVRVTSSEIDAVIARALLSDELFARGLLDKLRGKKELTPEQQRAKIKKLEQKLNKKIGNHHAKVAKIKAGGSSAKATVTSYKGDPAHRALAEKKAHQEWKSNKQLQQFPHMDLTFGFKQALRIISFMMATSDAAPQDQTKKKIIVVGAGAGVIGLTTALRILEKGGYEVEIIAQTFSTDPKCINYTSHWAGAHYVSSAEIQTLKAEAAGPTFKEFWELSRPGGVAEHCFLRLNQTEYYVKEVESPNLLETMPSYRKIPKEDLPSNVRLHAEVGYSFETVTVDVPVYLNWLLSCFLEKGGTIVRGQLQHLSQLLEAGTTPFLSPEERASRVKALKPGETDRPDAVVVCVGLGARTLGGIEDATVFPARGQTVLIRAPWINFGRTFSGENNEWTYIIPRKNGDVILGGTVGSSEDWFPSPRPETTRDILKRTLALCPELVPLGSRKEGVQEVETLLPLVIGEGCGLRPMRKEGLDISARYMDPPTGKRIPVVHNFGHGAAGYIESYGSADLALKLMEKGIEGA